MKNYITLLLIAGITLHSTEGSAITKHKKASPCNSMVTTPQHHGKRIAHHAVKKHALRRVNETVTIDDRSATAIVSIKDGNVYVNDSLVGVVKNPKNEDHRIIVNYIAPPPAPVVGIEHIRTNTYTGEKAEAMLGVYGGDYFSDGVFVDNVLPFSAADKAGMYPGDVITKVDDHDIKSDDDLKTVIAAHSAGDMVAVTVKNYEGTQTKQVELTKKEEVGNCGCERPMNFRRERRWDW